MLAVLEHVAKKEKFHLPEEAAKGIINDSQGNLRKALLVLEALKMQSYVMQKISNTTIHLSANLYVLART